MAARISICPYRLLFKHPFGTAHGLRDGTDSVFIRIEENGFAGYGEVTLPPYVLETIAGSIALVHGFAAKGLSAEAMLECLGSEIELFGNAQGCRAGIHTAVLDLLAKQQQRTVRELLGAHGDREPLTLMTLGIAPLEDLEGRLEELPQSSALKIKVGDPDASSRICHIKYLDNRRLFLDGNQGLRGIDEALELIIAAGADRVAGLEQPFNIQMDELNADLTKRTGIVVFGDESIQSSAELAAMPGVFGGVNVKLMKCGGLDRAIEIINAARAQRMQVMLGSMSESSLGCTAMAQLAGEADIVDLDGPWLIMNDPFRGIFMEAGRLIRHHGDGLGAILIADLNFDPIGA